MRIGAMIGVVAALLGSAVGCSGDNDGARGAGGAGGSGGTGAASGSGGSGGDPVAACVARQAPGNAACADCQCSKCLTDLEACESDTACAAILACTTPARCFGLECYLPATCQDVIDKNGGPYAASSARAVALGDCMLTRDCTTACLGVAQGDPISAEITVTDSVTASAVAGAEVCLLNTTTCATTDAGGFATLDVPALSEVALTVSAAGHLKKLVGIVSGASRVSVRPPVYSVARVAELAAAAGITLDDTKGHVLFGVYGPGGATAALSPASGTLVLTSAAGIPDPTLTGTVAGTSLSGIFWNVAPGDYDLTYSHPATTCSAAIAGNWAGSTPGAARVTVIAGGLSSGAHFGACDPVP